MTPVWDNQRNSLPIFLLLPIFQIGEGVTEPCCAVYRVIIKLIFQSNKIASSIANDITVEFSTEAQGALPALQVIWFCFWIFSIVFQLFGSQGAYSLIWGLRNGKECCFLISFHFCFSLITEAEIFHLSCGFFDVYNAVIKLLPLHFSR